MRQAFLRSRGGAGDIPVLVAGEGQADGAALPVGAGEGGAAVGGIAGHVLGVGDQIPALAVEHNPVVNRISPACYPIISKGTIYRIGKAPLPLGIMIGVGFILHRSRAGRRIDIHADNGIRAIFIENGLCTGAVSRHGRKAHQIHHRKKEY